MRPGVWLLVSVGAAASAGGLISTLRLQSSGAGPVVGIFTALVAAATGALAAWGKSQQQLRASVASFAQDAAKLKASSERDRLHLAAIVDAMTQGMIVVDRENRIEMLNDAARSILDVEQGAEGRPLIELARIPELFDVLRRAESSQTEVELRSGMKVVIRGTRQWGDGTRILLLEDVTEVRRLETIRRDFVANVSHELRTPVAVIRANAETLAAGALSDAPMAAKLSDALHLNAERLARILADLLDLSRLDAGQYRLDLEPLGLVDATKKAVAAMENNAAERGIRIDVTVDPGHTVIADDSALDQVLVNLIENAIKYSQPSGHLWLTAREQGGAIRVEVKDDGVGVPPHHRARLFERFYRADPRGSREKGGTGLGLSIVKHLVESMGGAVGVEPNHPQGSVFWFTLPRSQ